MLVRKLTGFESFDSIILITDSRGNTFYYMENEKCDRVAFNLIAGEYNTTSEISPLQRPLEYVLPNLPRPERWMRVPDNFDVEFTPNKNKASVNLWDGLAFVDNDYSEGDTPQLIFLQYHELGHYYYKTEWKCDVFAAYQMIKRGFNPSQCYYADACCLSDKNDARKNILLAWLKKVKCYE